MAELGPSRDVCTTARKCETQVMDPHSDYKIVDSWRKNARPWVEAVRGSQIESRHLVTDKAVLAAITDQSPRSLLDVGCGEGWLVRAAEGLGIDSYGIDVVPELIEAAKTAGPGTFEAMAYEQMPSQHWDREFDVVVCNFSLLGNESVSVVVDAVHSILSPSGTFVVQTVHPVVACGDHPYEDGWRDGSWVGFSEDFHDPAPWYFRTIDSWKDLFAASGFNTLEVTEPTHPKTKVPASILFLARRE